MLHPCLTKWAFGAGGTHRPYRSAGAFLFSVLIAAVLLALQCLFGDVLLAQPGVHTTTGVTPSALDARFKPRLGTYYYTFDFNNISIGIATITIESENDLLKVKVLAQTNSTIDRIYKIRYRGESVLETAPVVAPVQTTSKQVVKSTEKDLTMRFDESGEIKTVEKKSVEGATVDYEVRRVQTDRFTVDPFAAAYLVRGLDWKIGREVVFDVYGGKSRYELFLKCTGQVQLDTDGLKRNAYVIVPRVVKLDTDGKPVPPKKKPAETKIYLSADEYKDVLKIEASHTMGFFRATMDRFIPLVPQVRQSGASAPASSPNGTTGNP